MFSMGLFPDWHLTWRDFGSAIWHGRQCFSSALLIGNIVIFCCKQTKNQLTWSRWHSVRNSAPWSILLSPVSKFGFFSVPTPVKVTWNSTPCHSETIASILQKSKLCAARCVWVSLWRACWQTAIKTPTLLLGAVGLHFLTFNVLAMIISEKPLLLLYYNTSYLTTSITASPAVSQEAGQDTDLLALLAAIRHVSPFALWIFVRVTHRGARRYLGQCFLRELRDAASATAAQPTSSLWPPFVFAAASLERREISDHQVFVVHLVGSSQEKVSQRHSMLFPAQPPLKTRGFQIKQCQKHFSFYEQIAVFCLFFAVFYLFSFEEPVNTLGKK